VLDKRSRDGQKLFWRCDRKANRCPARLHTNATADDVVGRMREHNHLSGDAAALRVNRTRTTGSGVRQRTDRTAVQVHCMIIYAVINTLLLTRTCSLCITRRFQFTRWSWLGKRTSAQRAGLMSWLSRRLKGVILQHSRS